MSEPEHRRSDRRRASTGRIMRAGLLAALASAVVNEVLRWIAAGATDAPAGFVPLNSGSPAFWSVALLALATVLMLLLRRYTARPVRNFWILSVVALLVSFIPDIMLWANPQAIPGTTPTRVLVLMGMHVVAFLIAVPWIARAARDA